MSFELCVYLVLCVFSFGFLRFMCAELCCLFGEFYKLCFLSFVCSEMYVFYVLGVLCLVW